MSADKLMTWFTGVIAVAAIIAAMISGLQWCALDKQLTIIRGRPWVSLDGDPQLIDQINFDGNRFPSAKIDLIIQNSGSAPAKAVMWNTDLQIWPYVERPREWKVKRDRSDQADIICEANYGVFEKIGASNQGVGFIVQQTHITPRVTVRIKRGDSVAYSGKVEIFLVGAIGYSDPVAWYGERHPDHVMTFVEEFYSADGQRGIEIKPNSSISGTFRTIGWGDTTGQEQDLNPPPPGVCPN